jgi:hypothetical protein
LLLFLAGVVIWGLWRASRPPRLFAVRILGGKPSATTGTVTLVFLQQVGDVAAEFGVVAGQVWGVAHRDGFVSLGFSCQFPEAARQRLRNWWATFGWRAGKRRA